MNFVFVWHLSFFSVLLCWLLCFTSPVNVTGSYTENVNSLKKIRLVVEERWTWRPRSLYLQYQLQFLSFFSRTFVNTANFARKEILKLTESLTHWESCDIYQYCNPYHKFSNTCKTWRRLVWPAEILLWKNKTTHVVLISFAVVFGLLVFDICL